MRYKLFAVLLPCALALSACTTVTPAYKDNGTRSGPCVEGGPDDVAQKFYDTQIQNRTQDPAALRPYLSDGLAQLLNDARQDPANSKLLQANPFLQQQHPGRQRRGRQRLHHPEPRCAQYSAARRSETGHPELER
ncbi:probable lipoprotein [Klebsiella pneumoniae]|nr:probable lipoprotein [Klebsiella pneumoniae]VTN49134.1 lipoprotein [Klebsiella pneumoniae]